MFWLVVFSIQKCIHILFKNRQSRGIDNSKMPGRFPVALIQMEEDFYQFDEPPAWVGRHGRAIRGIFHTMCAWRECGAGDRFYDSLDMTREDIGDVTGETSKVKLCIDLFFSWIGS